MPPKTRPNNRLLVLCTSINDVTAWPFWKFLQMKRIKGVTDMALLAFNSEGGSFEARIDGEKYTMKNYAKVQGYKQEMFQSFLDRWYDPGRSYFVYGGHGMGDYLEFEQFKYGLQAHELAGLLDKRRFEAILFDACFMSNLDCAYHLRHNTRYIGACEGYMWEPDTALDYHIFNTFTASAMSRYRDPKLILETIQREYTSKAPRGDFAVLDTTHVAELRQFVQDHVIQRAYNRAMLYSPAQQERLGVLAEAAIADSIRQYGQPGGEAYLEELLTRKHPASAPASPDAYALANSGRLKRKQRVAAAIQFEHSLYPSEALDKHLVDLRSYLVDMAAEEDAMARGELAGANTRRSRRPLVRKAAAGAWSPSRAANVDAHGTLPPVRQLSCPRGAGGAGGSDKPVTNVAAADGSGTSGGGDASRVVVLPSASAASAPPSLYAPDSARHGLELFNKVVVSHVAPRAAGIYASRLGGLSVAIHEYSAMSKPVETWQVSRTILTKRTKTFLAKGSLEEVTMRREAEVAVATATTASSSAAAAADEKNTATAAAVSTGAATQPSGSASASATAGAPPVMITCHQTSNPSGASASVASRGATMTTANATALQGSHAAASAPLTLPLSIAAVAPRVGTATTTTPFLASSSSSYGSLSSRSRGYASYSCLSSRHSSPANRSLSSSVLSSLLSSADGAPVLRSRSADEVREIQRMAMEAAQLLDYAPPL